MGEGWLFPGRLREWMDTRSRSRELVLVRFQTMELDRKLGCIFLLNDIL